MRIDYCLPIIKRRSSEVLQIIQDNLSDYRYFEVWLDYLDDAGEEFMKQLISLLDSGLVLVFRRQNLDTIQMNLRQRLAILDLVDGSQTEVDLDITSQTAELEYATQSGRNLRVIASYHNYQETPNAVQLQTIIDTMAKYKPAAYKLATLCADNRDALLILRQLLKLKADGLEAVVIGMGEHGQVTRIFGALWGNKMTFAPILAAEQSAPGQLTRDHLVSIFKELGY